MMEYLAKYGLFLAETITVIAGLGLLVFLIAALSQREQRRGGTGHIEIHNLNERYEGMRDTLREALRDPAQAREQAKVDKKQRKKEEKSRLKAARKQRRSGELPDSEQPRLFVLDFDGDLRASAVEALREEITALLLQMGEKDEILLRLESGGGMVHSYGLAASQLQRLRDAGHHLTVSVDKVAASGGYMMACVADQIIAAPFAVLGSIGVIAQLPNFHKLLKKNDIDFEMLTAGEYKRTLTIFGENTEHGREKFQQELEDTHDLFKAFVQERRSTVEIDRVATGEVWYGQRAIDVKLVDNLQTSDDYIQQHLQSHGVFLVEYVRRRSWQQKLGLAAEESIERSILKLWQIGAQRPPH